MSSDVGRINVEYGLFGHEHSYRFRTASTVIVK